MAAINANVFSAEFQKQPWFNDFLKTAQQSNSLVSMVEQFKGQGGNVQLLANQGTFTSGKQHIVIDSAVLPPANYTPADMAKFVTIVSHEFGHATQADGVTSTSYDINGYRTTRLSQVDYDGRKAEAVALLAEYKVATELGANMGSNAAGSDGNGNGETVQHKFDSLKSSADNNSQFEVNALAYGMQLAAKMHPSTAPNLDYGLLAQAEFAVEVLIGRSLNRQNKVTHGNNPANAEVRETGIDWTSVKKEDIVFKGSSANWEIDITFKLKSAVPGGDQEVCTLTGSWKSPNATAACQAQITNSPSQSNNLILLNLKNEYNKNQTTATISGQGGEFNLENATITIASNASASIIGNNNTIKANNANVTIDGDNTTLTLSSKATGIVLGNNQTIKASAGCIVNVTGEDCDINGSSAIIVLGDNTEATINGTNNQITANANDTVNLSGSGHILNASHADINLADKTKVQINGSNNDIDGGSTVTVDVKGNDNTVDLGTKAKLNIKGNGSDISCGTDAKISLTGVGFIVDSSNAELTLDHAQLATVNGNNNDIDCSNQSSIKAVGTNNDINVIGIKNIVNASNANVSVQKDAEVSITGDNDHYAKKGSTVKLLGGINDTIKATEATISLDHTQVKIDGTADTITVGSEVTLTTLNTTAKNAHNITVTGVANQLNVSAVQNINVQDNAQATVMGANNIISTHENSLLTLQKDAANNTIQLFETGATINASKARIDLAGGISATVNGTHNSIYTSKNDTLTVVGDRNNIRASSENNKITITGAEEWIKGNNLTIDIKGNSQGTEVIGDKNLINYQPTKLNNIYSAIKSPVGSAAWFAAVKAASTNQDISIVGASSNITVTPPPSTDVVAPPPEPEWIWVGLRRIRNPDSPITIALKAKADAEKEELRVFLIDHPEIANLIATQAALTNIPQSISSVRLAFNFILNLLGGVVLQA